MSEYFSLLNKLNLNKVFPRFKKEYFDYIQNNCNYDEITVNIIKDRIIKTDGSEKVEIINLTGPMELIVLLRMIIIQSISFPSLISTNSARMRLVAGKDVRLFEFGLRRAQGPEAGLMASKYSCKCTFDSVSNVQAGLKFNLDVRGTSAHAYIMSYQMFNLEFKENISNPLCKKLYLLCLETREKLGYNTNITELLSFCMFTSVYKDDSILLIDTYNILESGIPNVVLVCLNVNKIGIPKIKGIRLDSGNLANQSIIAKNIFAKIAEENNLEWMKNLNVAASNDINEPSLLKFKNEGHKIDAFGIGTNLVTCQKQPYYKYKVILKNLCNNDVIKYDSFKFNNISNHKELNEYTIDVNELFSQNLS